MAKARKIISMIMTFVILCGLFVACQPAPAEDPAALASTPSSSVTPPPSSIPPTVPTTQPTVPTTQPTEPLYDIYDGKTWLSGSRLSWKVYDPYNREYKHILISDDARYHIINDKHIYFVKQSEPTNIYVVSIGDFSNHQLFYESTYGNITYMPNGETEPLQFVADNKKFVTIDITTGESTVLMEMYYIELAIMDASDGKWIVCEGKPTETSLYGFYHYEIATGEWHIDNSL